MTDELKGLIEKIQQEGIKTAEEKASAIEEQARKKADEILNVAHLNAEALIRQAEEKIRRNLEASEAALKQAGRNTLLELKKEINAILERVIAYSVRETLRHEELSKIIIAAIKECCAEEHGKIVVVLGKEDQEKLEKDSLKGLREEIKKGIVLKFSDDFSAGFMISYDSGKSYFDFTEQALAAYLSQYVQPALAKLL